MDPLTSSISLGGSPQTLRSTKATRRAGGPASLAASSSSRRAGCGAGGCGSSGGGAVAGASFAIASGASSSWSSSPKDPDRAFVVMDLPKVVGHRLPGAFAPTVPFWVPMGCL